MPFEEKEVPRPPDSTPMIVVVTRSVLIRAIREAGIDVPDNAQVTFQVPGGGDYSNCEVDLDDEEQVVSVRYMV